MSIVILIYPTVILYYLVNWTFKLVLGNYQSTNEYDLEEYFYEGAAYPN